MLLMLFVNDMAGIVGAPAWLKHIDPPAADGMTLPDIVLPAFLFIVGLSIPFGLEARRTRGESWLRIWGHILKRTTSLLVIGVFMVNSPAATGRLDPNLWSLLMYAGVILVWNDWGSSSRARWLRTAGIAILALAAILYRGPSAEPMFIEMTTQWWGILGLIGWAYLVGCAAYTVCHRDATAMLGAVVLLYCICLAAWMGLFSDLWLNHWVGIGSALGSNGGLAVSGVVLGRMLLPGSDLQTQWSRRKWGFVYGAGLMGAAVLLHSLHDLHQVFIYNKILATPPGALMVAALTAWLWVFVSIFTDRPSDAPDDTRSDAEPAAHWARWVAPGGRNALFIFILAPILYHAIWWSPSILGGFAPYGALGASFELGLLRSIGFAACVVWLSEVLRRAGVRLRL